MSGHPAGPPVERLIQLLARLPGLGPRSARRAALALIKRRETLLSPLAAALEEVGSEIRTCSSCGNIDTVDPCTICADPGRDRSLVCVVADVSDLWALERAKVLPGLYHVLGGMLSPLEGVGPGDLNLESLFHRAATPDVREVLLALPATIEGQTTAHYIMDRLAGRPVKVSRLAQGVPVGGELDYLDEGTLAAAIRARQPF